MFATSFQGMGPSFHAGYGHGFHHGHGHFWHDPVFYPEHHGHGYHPGYEYPWHYQYPQYHGHEAPVQHKHPQPHVKKNHHDYLSHHGYPYGQGGAGLFPDYYNHNY